MGPTVIMLAKVLVSFWIVLLSVVIVVAIVCRIILALRMYVKGGRDE